MLIADRLAVPDGTRALLWDMDGVLIDSLTMEYELVNELLSAHGAAEVPRRVIREYFPYDLPQFWRLLLEWVGLQLPPDALDELVRGHVEARGSSAIAVHDGVIEILAEARNRGLRAAVVSNNPVADVERILVMAGLRDYFSVVVGNDGPGMAKKPAPDSYLEAARRLAGPAPRVAIEDSLLGAQAANAAGCWTVGVATGAADFDALSAAPYVDRCYTSFKPCRVVVLSGDDVAGKSLVTPSEFVSQMLEDIARLLGCSTDVIWTNDDWAQLGRELGWRVAALWRPQSTSVAPAVIRDGSSVVILRSGGTGDVRLSAGGQVDLERFLGLSCGTLPDGQPLVSMLHGLAVGCDVDLNILVTSLEAPGHTWEDIFRGVGIALSKLARTSESALLSQAPPSPAREGPPTGASGPKRATPA
jgi:HAD superfamily hydrolase (TIGR01509 family)